MDRNVIMINPKDNVAVAIVEIKAGQKVFGIAGPDLVARSEIPRNHKVAIAKIARDAPVIKYGVPIGVAAETILPGDWVHTHNLRAEEN